VRSALEVFADEIDDHGRHGRCHARATSALPMPDPRTRDREWQ
jgi:hypothetical protein